MNNINDICIIGAGGVGGYFGGKIAHYLMTKNRNSQRVYFIARGVHLEEIRKNGLILNTDTDKGIVCIPQQASGDINDIPDCDLYMICVKSYDLDNICISLKNRVNENTVIIPLLNGVDIYERIRKHITSGIVLPACVYVGTHIEKPGMVTQKGGEGMILFGSDPAHPEFNPQGIIDFFNTTGIKSNWNEDPYPNIWKKFIFIAGYGLVTAFSKKAIGEVYENEILRGRVRNIMNEIYSIAMKKGIRLEPDIVEKSLEKAKSFPYETKTSFQRDVESKGSLNERDLFGGSIIRMGESLRIPVEETRRIYKEIDE